MAGFQVALTGRFWVAPDNLGKDLLNLVRTPLVNYVFQFLLLEELQLFLFQVEESVNKDLLLLQKGPGELVQQ